MSGSTPQQMRRRFIEAAGQMTQTLGVGRALGQVFTHIYFSRQPQSLDDLTQSLGISKGSASMTVRQLEQWGALRKVWIKGERKDYYEALDHFGRIIRRALLDVIGRKMESGDHVLQDAEEEMQEAAAGSADDATDWTFLRDRVAKIRAFRGRAQRLWDSSILKMLLK
ncbi:MAG TPA: hypothetical protein P5567_09045 [Kiritimatiellia bacterium]|nr:hypothetical protein [Kiritimatiellia bacterium]HRZ12587.1 hypothetical protein [Kiritimatiellia bacterium]HSA17665.1 hypothetical protein [Kiritimatiellia bacterium]